MGLGFKVWVKVQGGFRVGVGVGVRVGQGGGEGQGWLACTAASSRARLEGTAA